MIVARQSTPTMTESSQTVAFAQRSSCARVYGQRYLYEACTAIGPEPGSMKCKLEMSIVNFMPASGRIQWSCAVACARSNGVNTSINVGT